MNKVVSIEIASQVFWIDEQAYDILQAYLQKIRSQLVDDECADEIYQDIELRIAELLYGLCSDEKKAVVIAQLEQVIEQVGFIDDEDLDDTDIELEQPRRSYLDPQNKILGGVCSGLGMRFGVPAFVLRLVFISLTALFGLGIAIYLIFWITLETNTNRNAALAAQGKAQTAKRIASFEAPKASGLMQLQRVLFLPVSIIGMLLTAFGNHFKNRRKGYLLIIKTLFGMGLLMAALIVSSIVINVPDSRLFLNVVAWLLSASAMYLVILVLAIYFREYYHRRPNVKVNRMLKLGALIPIILISVATVYTNMAQWAENSESVEKKFAIKGQQLNLKFNEKRPLQGHTWATQFKIKTTTTDDQQLILRIDYGAYGFNPIDAKTNIRDIDYLFSFEGDTLILDNFWLLNEGAVRRGQSVEVTIEIPQNMKVTSTLPLKLNRDNRPYGYSTAKRKEGADVYLSSGLYLHENTQDFSHQLSLNERQVLENKFCEAFFISEAWRCLANIKLALAQNSRFDRAFEQNIDNIEQMRLFLLPDRSLFVSHLSELNQQVKSLSRQYPVMNDFQIYVEHLLSIKSTVKADTG